MCAELPSTTESSNSSSTTTAATTQQSTAAATTTIATTQQSTAAATTTSATTTTEKPTLKHKQHRGKSKDRKPAGKPLSHALKDVHHKQWKHKHHPTLSEQMIQDKKMAAHFRRLLRHRYLLKLMAQLEAGSGSGSGSGEGSGRTPTARNYVAIMQKLKKRIKKHHSESLHHLNHNHHNHHNHHDHHKKKTHLKTKDPSKKDDLVQLHPVPLSKLDLDLIDALSSGDPSEKHSIISSFLTFPYYIIALHILISTMLRSNLEGNDQIWSQLFVNSCERETSSGIIIK